MTDISLKRIQFSHFKLLAMGMTRNVYNKNNLNLYILYTKR